MLFLDFQQAIISGSYAFSYFNGLGAQVREEARNLAQRLGAELDYDPLSNADLMVMLRNESIDRIMDVAGDVLGVFHFPFHIYGPTIEQNSPTSFLSDIPSKLWATMKHNIPIMFGYSHYYGEQMTRAMENITGCVKRMNTRTAIKLLVNVRSDSIVDELAFKYLFENHRVFQITAQERDKYVLMLSERFFEQPLVKSIVDYNHNENIATKQLYLYVVDFRADTNAGDADHLFQPDPYAEQTGRVNHLLEMFESFIAHGHPPAGACIISDTDAQCPYVEISEDGAVKNLPAFAPVAVDFWKQFAPLPYQNWQ
jgi:Carboxylesterase family